MTTVTPDATTSRDGARTVSRVTSFVAQQGLFFSLASVLVIAIHLTVFLTGVYVSPVNFDEGYILQSPQNFVNGLGWGTYDWQSGSGGILLFDPLTSTGPTVLVPIAASFAVFGVGLEQARWVMLLFYGLFVACAWLLGHRTAGRWAGLAVALSVLALNTRVDFPSSVIFGPADVLGEIPAAAFILLSMLLLRRHPQLAGLALGLAAAAKLAALLVVPFFVLALLFVPRETWSILGWKFRGGREVLRRFLSAVVFGLYVLVPNVVWEAVKLLTLRRSAYLENLKSNIAFFRRSGSGVDGREGVVYSGRIDKYELSWFIPSWLALGVFVLALMVVVAVIVAVLMARHRGTRVFGRIGAPEIALVAVFVGYAVWWIFLSNSLFARQSFPGMLLGGPALGAFIAVGIGLAWSRRSMLGRVVAIALIAAWVVIGGTQTVRHVLQGFSAVTYTQQEQRDVASFLAENYPDGIQSLDYWQNPELLLLAQVTSRPYPTGTGPLVLSPLHRQLIPSQYESALHDSCREIVYSDAGFVVCTVDPTP